MTLAFIVRAEYDGQRWRLSLQDLTSGELLVFSTLAACLEALERRTLERAERLSRPAP